MNRIGWLSLAFVLTVCPRAHATPRFPDVIQQVVGTRGPPPCSLCHLGDLRTNYAVRTAFGMSLKARGLVPGDEDSLRKALELSREEDVDSDRDGITDIAELEAGSDPNVPGDRAAGPQIGYGCSLHPGRTPGTAGAALAAGLLGVGWARRRRTRSTARS